MKHSSLEERRCIYCSSSGPFSTEHVIPAGLGGDDKRFLLRDTVCKVCNTDVFSPIEKAFLRNTPTAIARLFMQREGRKRGSKRQPPKLETTEKSLTTPDGHTVEADMTQDGHATVLSQLLQTNDTNCQLTGSDRNAMFAFREVARMILGDSVFCLSKDDSRRITCSCLAWNNDKYVEKETSIVTSLPSTRIWIANLANRRNKDPHNSMPRLFQRADGEIVLRVPAQSSVPAALTIFRKAVTQVDTSSVSRRPIENPLVSFNLEMRTDVTARVLAKIGLNLIAHTLGPDYARHPNFQALKKTIATGQPEISTLPAESSATLAPIFSGIPHTHHVFLLAANPGHHGTASLALVARLYGSQVEALSLADGLPAPRIEMPVFFTVDYLAHRVERRSVADFLQLHPFHPSAFQSKVRMP